jgi:hypothetical protein
MFIKRTISQVADDPARVTQLEQLFLNGPARPKRTGMGHGAFGAKLARPASFWKDASAVAAQVAAMLEGDVQHVITLGGPGAGGMSLVTNAHATKLIVAQSHRLATPAEIAAFEETA